MKCPPEFGELFFDISEGIGERRTSMGIRRTLRKDAFTLEFQRLPLSLAVGIGNVAHTTCGCLCLALSGLFHFRLLRLNRLAFPSS